MTIDTYQKSTSHEFCCKCEFFRVGYPAQPICEKLKISPEFNFTCSEWSKK